MQWSLYSSWKITTHPITHKTLRLGLSDFVETVLTSVCSVSISSMGWQSMISSSFALSATCFCSPFLKVSGKGDSMVSHGSVGVLPGSEICYRQKVFPNVFLTCPEWLPKINYLLPLCNSLEIVDKMLLHPPPTSTSEVNNSLFNIFHTFILGGIFSRPPTLHSSVPWTLSFSQSSQSCGHDLCSPQTQMCGFSLSAHPTGPLKRPGQYTGSWPQQGAFWGTNTQNSGINQLRSHHKIPNIVSINLLYFSNRPIISVLRLEDSHLLLNLSHLYHPPEWSDISRETCTNCSASNRI